MSNIIQVNNFGHPQDMKMGAGTIQPISTYGRLIHI